MDWPPPVEILNPGGTSDIVLLCEHASKHIPAEYNGLGLGEGDLSRHIAWDIGAEAVTRKLSVLLNSTAFIAGYSRLLIDLNRPLSAGTSIVTRSEDTDIPGNLGLDPAETERRAQRIFRPFHDAVTACLDARLAARRPVRLVTIHSFTPVYRGVARAWNAGVLFDKAQAWGEAMVERLSTTGLKVGANVPYVSSRDEDYAIPVHGDDRGIPAILIEIRNDQITDDAGAETWAKRIAEALSLSVDG